MTTPDSLMPDCDDLPVPRASTECSGFRAKVTCATTLGSVEFELDDPGKEAPNDAYWIIQDLLVLLDTIRDRHVDILHQLKNTNNELEKARGTGPVGRLLRKLTRRPVNINGLNMVMDVLGEDHAILHDRYDQVNDALNEVAFHLIMMVDGSYTEEQYRELKERLHINRLLRRKGTRRGWM